MRHLWSCVLVLVSLPLVYAAQGQWPLKTTPLSTTLVDALSDDPDYTLLIRLLQRARLIPTLNRLNGSTFFAPTNDAIRQYTTRNPLWHVASNNEDPVIDDNVQEQLRQQLFYHLLNYTLTELPTDSKIQVHKTLLFPQAPSVSHPRVPPSPPPWMPVPGGLLGGEPQRVRLTSQEGALWVGVDASGDDGAQIVKEKVNATNGLLMGISSVLEMPPDLATILANHSSLSYLSKIATADINKFLNETANLTLFLPRDEAWETLHPLERLYLESNFSANDLQRILNMHAVSGKAVRWSESFQSGSNLTTIYGSHLEVKVSQDNTTVSNATLVQPDIYASNGVLHLVDSLLVPNGALQLTAEKYLLALNCTSFVSMLHSVGLTSLINDTAANYTILAPRDDVLSLFRPGDLPEEGSDELKALLLYHFLPQKWTPKTLKHGMLVETALEEPGLGGKKQVLGIAVQQAMKPERPPWKRITFGGVGVIDDPIEVNGTLVYFVSRPLSPPSDSLQTALPYLELSSFLAAIFSSSLADKLKFTPKTTFLIPHNSAFKRLGNLVSEHLLSATSKADLEKVIFHQVIKGVEYTHDLKNGSQHTFPTLEGSDLQLDRYPNGSLFIHGSGGWSGMTSELRTRNRLTKTGVMHELSDILIPRSVDLTMGKLMKAAKGSTMGSLINRAGMDWALNGTAPPDDSPWSGQGLHGVGWTLLCPTDDAFKDVNLTLLYSDIQGIRDIVEQHLIPTPKAEDSVFLRVFGPPDISRPLPFEGEATFSTLRTASSSYGDIVFRNLDDGEQGYVVGIKGARGTSGKTDRARVMGWGRATTGHGTGGVIQISQLLVPYYPPGWIEYGGPALLAVIGVLAIYGFFYCVLLIWRRDTTEATYEPVGGFGRDED